MLNFITQTGAGRAGRADPGRCVGVTRTYGKIERRGLLAPIDAQLAVRFETSSCAFALKPPQPPTASSSPPVAKKSSSRPAAWRTSTKFSLFGPPRFVAVWVKHAGKNT